MMNNITNYRKTKSVVSFIRYHIIFCTRYRRKIFSYNAIASWVTFLITDECEKLGMKLEYLNFGDDYVELILECPPDLSPSQIVSKLKTSCNDRDIKEKFHIPNSWTRSYLISTEQLNEATIKMYVSSQKKRK